ncbi:MAG: hypothetical protein BM556_00230 [Bacteriovorax sp. MedPE-SWde]|nr:MAG: hypothetical protein BM556_00230 [Bacteriovorax sp. MedPE-SWde]
MSAKKPLIFIQPLSESLQKLKDVIEEVAEEEKIEVFEVEDASEVAQLIPTVGQSLSIFGNPKKCAAVLQPNRKVIQKLNSKVILLSKKSMPRKTLDKFSKIGLTECIVEPVAPKTLLYKVRLLLRSIVVAKDEEDEEESSFDTSSDSSESSSEKQRLEKGVLTEEEEAIDYNLKGKINQGLEMDAEEDEGKKNGYSEEAIEKDWKGSVEQDNLELDEEEKKKRDTEDSENYIDSYLRGKKSSHTDELIDHETSSKNKDGHDEDEEEDLYGKNKELSLDLVAEEDDDEKDRDGDDLESDDKYYKGKVAAEDLELEAEEQNKRAQLEDDDDEEEESPTNDGLIDMELEAEDDVEKNEDELELEDEEESTKENGDTGLDLEADEEERPSSEEELELEEDENNKTNEDHSLDLEDESDSNKKKDEELELEEERNRPEFEKQEEEEQDSHYRGDVAQVVELIDEEDIDARNRHDLDADEDLDDGDNNEIDNSLDLDADDEDSNDNKDELELEESDDISAKDKDNGIDLESDDEDQEPKSDGLELIGEEGNNENSDSEDEDDEDEMSSRTSNNDLDLAFDDESDAEKSKEAEDEDENYNTKTSGLDLDLEDDDQRKKHSAHTEHIDTRMDSRKAIDHTDQDWDILGKKNKSEGHDEESKKKSDIQISFKEKVDLGEQTIDYRKLQNEFDAITINRVGGKRKKTGPKYYSDDMTEEEYLKGVYGADYDNALDDISENLKNRKDKKADTVVYNPMPQGLDEAVRVMNLYHNKSLKKEDIFSYIANSLLNRFGGHTFFFSINPDNGELFNSFALNETNESVDSEVIEKWTQIKEENYDEWLVMNLPVWTDEKLITDDNIFFYPIYEGANKLGFAVVLFNKLIERDQAKSVEIILETVRGIVLEEFHSSGKTEEYNVDLTKKKGGEEKKEGFVKSFFGKFKKKKAS